VLILLLGACGADLTLPADNLPAELVAVSGDEQQGEPGARLPEPLVVEVRDAQGRPVRNVRVEFRFAHAATGASVAPGSVATGADGRAAARVVLPRSEGDQVVEAALAGADQPNLATSFLLTARAAPGGGAPAAPNGGNGQSGSGQDGDGEDGNGGGHGRGHDKDHGGG
jgi:hypothetical protein